jgi:putative ABC transport system permease protein
MNYTQQLIWICKMAWRDTRRNPSRLFLFLASIILGIAALVSIYSLSANLERQIDSQAASLLGADQEWVANRPFSEIEIAAADSLAESVSEEWSFGSMVLFPKNQGTRLTQIRALEGAFPFYGTLETTPSNAASRLTSERVALVDHNLMLQYQIQTGDSIKVGEVTFCIAGALQQAPGQTGIVASVAPVVYIPLRWLEETGLNQKGSRINYRLYLKLKAPELSSKIAESMRAGWPQEEVNIRTIEDQKASTGRLFANLTNFLGLAGFIALLLGCIGVASAVHLYIKEKFNSIAILRCLGVTSAQAFLIFLIQIGMIGLVGSILGAVLGTLLQNLLPSLVEDFLPFEFTPELSPVAALQGVGLGVVVSLLFSLSSLLRIRTVEPLNVFRIQVNETNNYRDPVAWLIYTFIVLFVVIFSYLQLKSWKSSLLFSGAVVASFLFLAAFAQLIISAVRRFFPSNWGFIPRQGLSNLFRPNNQTLTMIVALGLGTMLISTLLISRKVLLHQITTTVSSTDKRPNMILFDIQDDQLEALKAFIVKKDLTVIQSVPIVNMRLENINGYDYLRAQKDSLDIRARLFSREYRVTYRDSLSSSEKIVEGNWTGDYQAPGLVPVSMESGYASSNGLKVGDTLTFNVQGMRIRTRLASLREVDWRGMQTNFILVFPKGVLERAPKFHVISTFLPTLEKSALFQQDLVRHYPNISIVDLNLILNTLDTIASKVGFVIRFMALFSVLSGLIVLFGAVVVSKYQRIKESVLLRTIGATRRQILWITGLEYFFLGALSAFTGIFLSLVAGWSLAKYSFRSEFVLDWGPVALVFLGITSITVAIGLLNSREIVTRSPLDVLRQESG